ncbi:MAG: response regulator transcription factor [Acidimicrobiales bacterium]
MNDQSPIRIVIADDDALVRAGLRMVLDLQPDFEVVGEAGDGVEAIALAESLRPDVVLMDIRMPELDGIEATRRITGGSAREVEADVKEEDGDLPTGPRVLVLTTFEVDEYVYEAVRAGASGFLLKRSPPEEVVAGIRVVASGDALLSPSVTRRLLGEFAKTTAGDDTGTPVPSIDAITAREREVLELIAQGLTNGEIAAQLFVSEGTVKTHVKRILMKLQLRDRVHAVVFAYESGLVRPRN